MNCSSDRNDKSDLAHNLCEGLGVVQQDADWNLVDAQQVELHIRFRSCDVTRSGRVGPPDKNR